MTHWSDIFQDNDRGGPVPQVTAEVIPLPSTTCYYQTVFKNMTGNWNISLHDGHIHWEDWETRWTWFYNVSVSSFLPILLFAVPAWPSTGADQAGTTDKTKSDWPRQYNLKQGKSNKHPSTGASPHPGRVAAVWMWLAAAHTDMPSNLVYFNALLYPIV